MAKQPGSLRTIARTSGISHTSVAKFGNYRREAEDRGIYDEYYRRVMAGERIGTVLQDLMPDVYQAQQLRQRIAAFRSAAKKLVEDHGCDHEDLVYLLEHTTGTAADQAAMAEARGQMAEDDLEYGESPR